MEKDKQNKPQTPVGFLTKIKNFLLGNRKRTIIIILILVLGFLGWQKFGNTSKSPTYQTAQVTKGTIVSSVSESGSVSVANRASITTQASGVVSQVYVKTVTRSLKVKKSHRFPLIPMVFSVRPRLWHHIFQLKTV